MGRPADFKRNSLIIAFVEANDWSFQLVADNFSVSRNTVAGIMFRYKHPVAKRMKSPGGRSKNKIGTGHGGYSYTPAYHARNSVVR
jgi:hypothetical protein